VLRTVNAVLIRLSGGSELTDDLAGFEEEGGTEGQ